MDAAPPPPRTPPPGVPRWLFPPPGATLRTFEVIEARVEPGAPLTWVTPSGEVPDRLHLRALTWILEEHPRADAPPTSGRRRIRLDVARTSMAQGRVGHAYALDGGPIGAPRGAEARGVLWRWIHHVLDETD